MPVSEVLHPQTCLILDIRHHSSGRAELLVDDERCEVQLVEPGNAGCTGRDLRLVLLVEMKVIGQEGKNGICFKWWSVLAILLGGWPGAS